MKLSKSEQVIIVELGKRFDYCRSQIEAEALDDFANNRWRQMVDNMEKAATQLELCIRDARLLSRKDFRK